MLVTVTALRNHTPTRAHDPICEAFVRVLRSKAMNRPMLLAAGLITLQDVRRDPPPAPARASITTDRRSPHR